MFLLFIILLFSKLVPDQRFVFLLLSESLISEFNACMDWSCDKSNIDVGWSRDKSNVDKNWFRGFLFARGDISRDFCVCSFNKGITASSDERSLLSNRDSRINLSSKPLSITWWSLRCKYLVLPIISLVWKFCLIHNPIKHACK